mgnify:CR=1 FL=1
MTHFITAYTPNMVIMSETRTTDETLVADIVAALEARGFIVHIKSEG